MTSLKFAIKKRGFSSHFLLPYIGKIIIFYNQKIVPTIGYIYDIDLFVWSVDERPTIKAEYLNKKILANPCRVASLVRSGDL